MTMGLGGSAPQYVCLAEGYSSCYTSITNPKAGEIKRCSLRSAQVARTRLPMMNAAVPAHLALAAAASVSICSRCFCSCVATSEA